MPPHIPECSCFGGSQCNPYCSVIPDTHRLKIAVVSAEVMLYKIAQCSLKFNVVVITKKGKLVHARN